MQTGLLAVLLGVVLLQKQLHHWVLGSEHLFVVVVRCCMLIVLCVVNDRLVVTDKVYCVSVFSFKIFICCIYVLNA